MYVFLLSPYAYSNDLNEEANRRTRIGKVCDSAKTFNGHSFTGFLIFSLCFPHLSSSSFSLLGWWLLCLINVVKREKGVREQVSQTVIGVLEFEM